MQLKLNNLNSLHFIAYSNVNIYFIFKFICIFSSNSSVWHLTPVHILVCARLMLRMWGSEGGRCSAGGRQGLSRLDCINRGLTADPEFSRPVLTHAVAAAASQPAALPRPPFVGRTST